MATTIPHWIDGAATPLGSTRTSVVTNPATGQVTGELLLAEVADVDLAVASAATALESWRDTSMARRTAIMFAYRQLVDAHRLELAEMISAEHGKVRADALGEVARGLEVIEFACGIGEMLKGDRTENVSTGVDAFTVRQPVGVVAGITPFNFPVMVPMWMFPMAIACGNTFVLKPSEKDPSVSIRMAELLTEAGLPDGVFNVVQGDAVAVNRLLEHPDVDAVSFVGSTPIAQHVQRSATEHGKRVQALGGAKNHMVVLPDADVDQTADAAVSAAYGSAGERCMAISVLAAVGDIADPLVDAIATRIDKLAIGTGLSEDPMDMGALVTEAHRDRVASYIDAGEAAGATLVRDGRGFTVENHADGFWLGATLFDHVSTDMTIYTDEIFGPVLVVVRCDTYDDALELVNSNPFGNGTAIFTKDGGAARAYQRDCEVGMVGVNVPIPVPMAFHSFGGWGDSIFGDHHIYGPEGVRFYTRLKAVTQRWPDPHEQSRVDLGFPTNG